MANLLQRLRGLFGGGSVETNGYYPLDYEEEDDLDDTDNDDGQRQLFTALDIGTAYAKAMIVEVRGDHAIVLGAGRYPQNYMHMSDGIVTAGELVKGSSYTVNKERLHPTRPITPEELQAVIKEAQNKLLKKAKERIMAETGLRNID